MNTAEELIALLSERQREQLEVVRAALLETPQTEPEKENG